MNRACVHFEKARRRMSQARHNLVSSPSPNMGHDAWMVIDSPAAPSFGNVRRCNERRDGGERESRVETSRNRVNVRMRLSQHDACQGHSAIPVSVSYSTRLSFVPGRPRLPDSTRLSSPCSSSNVRLTPRLYRCPSDRR